ncbi:MAG: hypothetical protein GF329_12075 [Candidatus Lokiarchaeota archaeon]|nr:hypothetical protein [Candidatus Lokiarchaeota archaeon]
MGTFKFKLVVLGSDENKSSILKKYLHSCFNKDYSYVIGCNIFIRYENLDFDELTYSIWDISPAERFRFFRTSFYYGSCAVLIFVNLNEPKNFTEIPSWIEETSEILDSKPVFIVGYSLNSDNVEDHREQVVAISEQYNGNYFEVNSRDDMDHLFRQISTISLDQIGYSKEKRNEINEQIIAQNKKLKELLTELGFNVIDNKKVEILTNRGIFTVNILNGKVYYEHFICEKCNQRYKCKKKIKDYNIKKSLCIVRKDHSGWSNVLDSKKQLLTLSKIYAIMEDQLPQHVINQMCSSIHCETGKKIFKEI